MRKDTRVVHQSNRRNAIIVSKIVIYKAKDGHIELDVSLAHDTLWLSQQQMADLFGTQRPAITKHLKNIFNTHELTENAVCSKMERTASDGKRYKTKFYSLDAVIAVGYRVNSHHATQFRIWATQILKEHLTQGYTLREQRLAERGVSELQQSIALLQQTLQQNNLIDDIGVETLRLITHYAKTWHVLLAYDEDTLALPDQHQPSLVVLDYSTASHAIASLKSELIAKNEATALFGHEYNHGLQGILGNIEQTFDAQPLYQTVEERAAHLLYFVIKDHPFSDGNKRIGCLLFLMYLELQNKAVRLNDNGLIALALLTAESQPSQKDLVIRLIVTLLMD